MEAKDREPASDPAKWETRVLRVTGRGSDDSRGLPPAHTIALSHPDGSTMEFGPVPEGKAIHVRVHVFGVPEVHDFGACPICGSPEELTREHVPQRDLGGTVMTYACKACNNGLGSRVEDELKHWFDGAIFDVKFSGGDVPGRRKSPRMLLRATADGKIGLIQDVGKGDPNIGKILASGGEINYRIPNPRVWRVAALKHAYLGACLALREVPNTKHAAILRGVLVATRDGKRGELPPESNLAKTLRIAQSNQPAQGPTVLLAALVNENNEVVDYGLSFAGTLFVSWPLDAHLFWEAVHRLHGCPPQPITSDFRVSGGLARPAPPGQRKPAHQRHWPGCSRELRPDRGMVRCSDPTAAVPDGRSARYLRHERSLARAPSPVTAPEG